MRLMVGLVLCALVTGARAAGVDWSQARSVSLTAVEYAFEPKHLIFRRDVAYRLHLENHGRELHELTAPDFFKSVELRNPDFALLAKAFGVRSWQVDSGPTLERALCEAVACGEPALVELVIKGK